MESNLDKAKKKQSNLKRQNYNKLANFWRKMSRHDNSHVVNYDQAKIETTV